MPRVRAKGIYYKNFDRLSRQQQWVRKKTAFKCVKKKVLKNKNDSSLSFSTSRIDLGSFNDEDSDESVPESDSRYSLRQQGTSYAWLLNENLIQNLQLENEKLGSNNFY